MNSIRPDTDRVEEPEIRPPFSPPLRPPEGDILRRYRGPGLLILLGAAAVAFALLVSFANYNLGQAPHRMLKAILGAGVAVVAIARPDWLLLLLPFALPYLTWLPKSGIPMVNGMNLLIFCLLAGRVGRSLATRSRFLSPTPWDGFILAFLGWMAFAWLRVAVLECKSFGAVLVSVQQFWSAVAGLFIYFMIYNNLRDWKQLRRLALATCLGAAMGMGGLWGDFNSWGGARRVSGGVGQENIAGAFYAMATIFALGMLFAGYRGLLRKLGLGVCFIISAVAMVLTGSRGAFAGFIAGTLPQVIRGGILWILVLILMVTGFALWAPESIRERVVSTQEAVSTEAGQRYDALNQTAGGRLDFWKASLKVIAQQPLLGVGFGRIGVALRPYLGVERPSHNVYLEVAAEMGIPGLFLLLLLLGTAWWRAGDLLIFPGFPHALGVAYRSALIALVVCNLFGNRFFDSSLLGFFSLISALVFRARSFLLEERAGAAIQAGGGR